MGPFMRRLTPQVVAQAGRPHCHLSGPAAQERVTTTSKRAHRPTRAQSGARAQNHGVNVQTLPTRRREQMPPPSIPTFPHQKAKKSPFQQHAVSYNPKLRSPGTPAESRGCWRRRRDLNPRGAMHPYLLSREAHSTGLCDVSSADYFRAFSPRARTCARRDARGQPTRRRARDSNPRCHC